MTLSNIVLGFSAKGGLASSVVRSESKSHYGETVKSCEMIQSWPTDLVQYENFKCLSRRNRKNIPFATS